MASLRNLPLDIVQNIVAYLDLNAISILFGTLDTHIQRMFVAGAADRSSLRHDVSGPLYPAQRYLLKSIKEVDRLILECTSHMRNKVTVIAPFAKLAPRHLEWHFRRSFSDLDYRGFFHSLRTLKSVVSDSLDSLFHTLRHLPSTLRRFHLSLRNSESILSDLSLDHFALLSALPPTLVELVVDLVQEPSYKLPATIPLESVCDRFTKLEVLDLTGVDCGSHGKTFAVPSSLRHLSISSYSALVEAKLASSNISRLTISGLSRFTSKPKAPLDLAQLLPPCLVQLQLPIVSAIKTLPPSITTLKIDPVSENELARLLGDLILPLQLLRTLSLSITTSAPLLAALPRSLTHLILILDRPITSPKEVLNLFSPNALFSPGLHLDFELNWSWGHEEFVIPFALAFPHANIKVTTALRLLPKEHLAFSRGLGEFQAAEGTFTGLSEAFSPEKLLRSISSWLNSSSTGRLLQFSLCLCTHCMAVWRPELYFAKKLVIPVAALKGQTLVSHGGIAFVEDLASGHHGNIVHLRFPPSLEELHLKVPVGYQDKPSPAPPNNPLRNTSLEIPTTLPPAIVVDWMIAAKTFSNVSLPRLKVLDLGAAPLVANKAFWNALPRTLTVLKSSYEFDPQLKLGGKTKEPEEETVGQTDDSEEPPPLDLVVLDTPYFVFSFDLLGQLVSKATLTTLSATIKDADTQIFEFALGRGKLGAHSFPLLENLQLKAIPTMSGMLVCNNHTHITLHTLEHEMAQVFRLVDVFVVECVYSYQLTLPPAVTHAIIDDVPETTFLDLKCPNRRHSTLQSLKARVSISKYLQFPRNLTSLDLTILPPRYSISEFLSIMPPNLRSLRLAHGEVKVENVLLDAGLIKESWLRPSPKAIIPTFTREHLPRTLESLTMLSDDPERVLELLPLRASLLSQLAFVELASVRDIFLSSLCHSLPKTTQVKVETAKFTGGMTSLDEAQFSWKSAFSQAISLEKRYPRLEIANWRATDALSLAHVTDKLTFVCLDLDFKFESIFEKRARNERFVPLMKDLIAAQAAQIVPIALPSCVERLELCITRKLFQSEPFKSYAKEVAILGTRKLLDATFPKLPNLTHLTLQRVDIPADSALEWALLPASLQVLSINIAGNIRTQRKLHLIGFEKSGLHELNLSPSISVSASNPQGLKFSLTRTKDEPM